MKNRSRDSEKTLGQVVDSGPSIDTIFTAFVEDLNQKELGEQRTEQEEQEAKSPDPTRTKVVEDTIDAFWRADASRRAQDRVPNGKDRAGSNGEASHSSQPTSNPQVVSVCSHKGGTGKTTTTIHLAAALGLSGWRSLVIDLDPQGFLTRAINGGEPPVDQSVAAFFDPAVDLQQIQFQEVGGFDLIPASSTLTRRMQDLNEPTDVLWVREALANADLPYDFIFIDTAATMTVYTLNALVASQHVLIPVLPEYQSVVGGEQTYQTAQLVEKKLNPQLRSKMFLLTQVDGRKRAHQTYQEYVREKYGAAVLESIVRTNASLARCQEEGQTVFDHDSTSRGAQDYARVADEVVGRVQEIESAERPPTCAQKV
jgi:chromosome partitioning protein